MLIQVHYPDNRFDYVKDDMLQHLIESKEIARFRRSSGWVTVGVDPLRQFRRNLNYRPAAKTRKIVRVLYHDNRYDYVTGDVLNTLIESNKIKKFERITGWVTVGVDPLRKANRNHTYTYPSEEKKRALP